MTKEQLKNAIALAQEEDTFETLKKAGFDLSGIEERFNKWERFINKLRDEKKQFSSEDYKKYREEKESDIKSLIMMIDLM